MQINIANVVQLYRDECIRRMALFPDRSIDLVVCDLPYGGFTGCAWDVAIDLRAYWAAIGRILKPFGVVVAFGAQPFTSALVTSNPEWFRYSMVWKKSRPTGFLQCWQRPLTEHEDILVFSPGNCASGKHNEPTRSHFDPQGVSPLEVPLERKSEIRMGFLGTSILPGARQEYTNFPRSVLEFASVHKPLHPTQKPVELLRYLIRSYSRPGEVVLDPTMGVGSTGEAAASEGRAFIGIELDEAFFSVAVGRLDPRISQAA